jgi:uncharacterized membrane protein YidH (DUF202 family)
LTSDSSRPVEVWDEGLQNERTALAWGRSFLSCLGCLLLLARLAAEVAWALGAALALAAVALGFAAAWMRGHRYRRAAGALGRGHHLPDGTLNLIIAGFVVAIGVTAAGLILIQR